MSFECFWCGHFDNEVLTAYTPYSLTHVVPHYLKWHSAHANAVCLTLTLLLPLYFLSLKIFLQKKKKKLCNWVHCVCVAGHCILTFLSVLRSHFWLGESFMALTYKVSKLARCAPHSSGAVWKSRWPSWAPIPNNPTVSMDVMQHSTINSGPAASSLTQCPGRSRSFWPAAWAPMCLIQGRAYTVS